MPRRVSSCGRLYAWFLFLLSARFDSFVRIFIRRERHVRRRFTRGRRSLLVGNHPPEFGLIGRIGHNVVFQLSLAGALLGSQDMAGKRMPPYDFARPGLFEPFGRTLM